MGLRNEIKEIIFYNSLHLWKPIDDSQCRKHKYSESKEIFQGW